MPNTPNMRKRIAQIWHRSKQPFDRLWQWATGHPRRWHGLVRWARAKREQAREDRRINRAKFWVKKRTIYARKWRRAKKRLEQSGEAKFEPWMLNGHSANITAGARAELAIAVVKFGCACTSSYRATVIPQSNPNSWHGPNVSPGKAVDVAGGGMVAYQRDAYNRRRGDANLLELFGPDNSSNLRYGQTYYLAEGTFLENLHDSHTHVACQ